MTVREFLANDRFIARTFKWHEADPGFKWTNTYEFYALLHGDTSDISTLLQRLMTFEQALHGTAVHFEKATMSTWQPDSVPYNPESFFELDGAGAIGQKDLGEPEDQVPLSVCLSLRRQVAYGRQGIVQFRGCLSESDVEWAIKGFKLTNQITLEAALQTALISSSVNGYLSNTQAFKMAMVGVAKGSETVNQRPVLGLHVHGASLVQVDHNWYDLP